MPHPFVSRPAQFVLLWLGHQCTHQPGVAPGVSEFILFSADHDQARTRRAGTGLVCAQRT